MTTSMPAGGSARASGRGRGPARWPEPVRAAIFDLDGTLADSEERSTQAWRAVLRAHGLPCDEALIASFKGRRRADTLAAVAARFPTHDPAVLATQVHEHFHAPGQPPLQPFPGAVEFVRQAHGRVAAIGLVTSAGRAHAEHVLGQFAMREMFSIVVGAEDVARGKPDPEGYLAAARALGLSGADCVVFEDSPAGVGAAKAAGMFCVAVATTHGSAGLAGADVVVPSLAEFPWPGADPAGRGLTRLGAD